MQPGPGGQHHLAELRQRLFSTLGPEPVLDDLRVPHAPEGPLQHILKLRRHSLELGLLEEEKDLLYKGPGEEGAVEDFAPKL
eukprot:8584838-Lingulodinium_polyedra.AAC.1